MVKANNIALLSILILYVGVLLYVFIQPGNRNLILTEREQLILRNAIHENEEGRICIHGNSLNIDNEQSTVLKYNDKQKTGIEIDEHGTTYKVSSDHISKPMYMFQSYSTDLKIDESFQHIYVEGVSTTDKLLVHLQYENKQSCKVELNESERLVVHKFQRFFTCHIQTWDHERKNIPVIGYRDTLISVHIEVIDGTDFVLTVLHT